MSELKKEYNYLVVDHEEGETIECETLEEALKKAKERVNSYCSDDGWTVDLHKQILVAKVLYKSLFELKADKKDYTDEEWEEEGYSLDHDQIFNYPINPIESEAE